MKNANSKIRYIKNLCKRINSKIFHIYEKLCAHRKYDIKSAYDWVYDNVEIYNSPIEYKNKIIDDFAEQKYGLILDAGCGEGIHLKRLLSARKSVFGVELSSVCCEKNLRGLPHENVDIVSHLKENRYDAIICFDVLEHIPYSQLDIVLSSMKVGAPVCLLGISNHSDVFNGKELHLIQRGPRWWENELRVVFSEVKYIDKFDCIRPSEIPKNRFFVFECSR